MPLLGDFMKKSVILISTLTIMVAGLIWALIIIPLNTESIIVFILTLLILLIMKHYCDTMQYKEEEKSARLNGGLNMADGYISKEEAIRRATMEERKAEIIRINQEAKDANMSYGHYVALDYIKHQHNKRNNG